jgi:hypothetical protein
MAAKKRRSKYTNHVLSKYACSPKQEDCVLADELHRRAKSHFLSLYESQIGVAPQDAALLSLLGVFHQSYNEGWIWYPRDRWRTAWDTAMKAGRRNLGSTVNDLKTDFYHAVSALRNPSSRFEGMK